MNDELILILDSIRDWAVTDYKCKGDILNIVGTLTNPWKCEGICNSCPVFQVRKSSFYPDQIIQTFSQLNK